MPKVETSNKRTKRTIGSRGEWYSPLTCQTYSYQSSYERELMNFLDNNNIPWIKNKERFPYLREGKKHNYIPDFYLPTLGIYIETKGFTRKSDPLKFQAFPEDKNLVLLLYEDLLKLGCKVFNPCAAGPVNLNKWPMTILGKIDEWQQPGELDIESSRKVSSKKFFNILKEKNIPVVEVGL